MSFGIGLNKIWSGLDDWQEFENNNCSVVDVGRAQLFLGFGSKSHVLKSRLKSSSHV